MLSTSNARNTIFLGGGFLSQFLPTESMLIEISKLAVSLDLLAKKLSVIPQLPRPRNHLRKPQSHSQNFLSGRGIATPTAHWLYLQDPHPPLLS